jgi:protein-L-isoaspartate(D-aspartate) O-methyltransferase
MKKTIGFIGVFLFFAAVGNADIGWESPETLRDRKAMVNKQIRPRGIKDPETLKAMLEVPRHLFVPDSLHRKAYSDRPLPIGSGQTISQPYIVALMTESLGLTGSERVLEIGTGSGYQAAILANIASQVYTMEIKADLYRSAKERLAALGFANVHSRRGDGYFGWQKAAPFDCIMITAAVDHIPPPLLKQRKKGGRQILTQGNPFNFQNLALVEKQGEDFSVEQITGVLFVPMTGYALEKNK